MSFLQPPIFGELQAASSILLAGAGGGFDLFSGLPLYFGLTAAGKRVHLANLTFSNLPPSAGEVVAPACAKVTADSEGSKFYFPEKHLCQWLRDHGHGDVPVYAFHRVGVRPITDAYRRLADMLRFDTVIVVDGGTDSLMRGDEAGLGTPCEDVASIAAVHALAGVPRKFLVCLGFGIDAFHGVCHAQVLEAVAELTRTGDYLGAFSLTADMAEVRAFADVAQYVLDRTPDRASIVCTSILSAIEGQFGDHHRTDRTTGSRLFINPLMSLYWAFHLDGVARRIRYLDEILQTDGYVELQQRIAAYRSRCDVRPWTDIPI